MVTAGKTALTWPEDIDFYEVPFARVNTWLLWTYCSLALIVPHNKVFQRESGGYIHHPLYQKLLHHLKPKSRILQIRIKLDLST